MTLTTFELATFGPVAALSAVAVCLHALGERRMAGRFDAPSPGSAARPWMFRGAALLAVLILLPPIGRWARDQLFARSMVDATLAFGVAPLVVLSAPWRAFAIWGRTRSKLSSKTVSVPGAPVAAVAVLAAVVLLWHLPGVVDASAGSAPLWVAEMTCYLVAGILLWLQLVGSHPFVPAWGPLARTWLVAVVLAGLAVIAAAMLFTSGNWYPAFDAGRHHLLAWSLDQGFAGAIGGILPAVPLGAFVWWAYTEWLRQDEDGSVRVVRPLGTERADSRPRVTPLPHLSVKEGAT